MTRRWIADASPLIILARAQFLHLLLDLSPKLIIPSSVAQEIRLGRSQDPARQWLIGAGSRHVEDPIPIDARLNRWDLGSGESEVLSFALTIPEATAVIDDRAARNCASSLKSHLSELSALSSSPRRKD